MQLKNRNNTIFNKNDTDADYDPPRVDMINCEISPVAE